MSMLAMAIATTRMIHRHLLACLVASSLGCWVQPSLAQDVGQADIDADAQDALGPEWIPVTEDRLAGYRGGFELPSGLLLSFGFERLAFVNGQLVSSLRIDIPDISKITPEQAESLAKLQQTQLVQIGPGNVFDANGMGGLVIQNTLDGQDIRAQTTLDVSVNTLGMFKELNGGFASQFALIGAKGGL